MRLGLSPYPWSERLLAFLTETQGLNSLPSTHNSSPLWSCLLVPITCFTFPSAASLWVFLLVLLAVYCHVVMLRIAGYTDWKTAVLALPVTLTFGPIFVNFTMGQNAIFLLLSALLLGEALKNKPGKPQLLAVIAWIAAVGAKVYPLLWIGTLLIVKRRFFFVLALTLCLVAVGMVGVLAPDVSADYWFVVLPGQTQRFATQVGPDDNSLAGFLTRVGTSTTYTFGGLGAEKLRTVTWLSPWDFSVSSIRYFSFALLFVLGIWLTFRWIQNGSKNPDGVLYSLILFILLVLPHMDRYNHVLALPAMVWLWKQDPSRRYLTVIAYAMFGLSRLNRLWALLPSPIGPMATGFGFLGILVLTIAIAHSLNRADSLSARSQ